ncbi:MAG: undecaprenyl-diphosphate phosphatase [Alphaproteobacteria bacterium]
MEMIDLIILAIIQGITEFLPISSQAHIILGERILNVPNQGVILEVAVHIGSLGAVVAYLWKDILAIFRSAISFLRTGKVDAGGRLAIWVVLGTIPAVIAGFLLHKFGGDGRKTLEVIAWATIGFGILLYVSDRFFQTQKKAEDLTFWHVIAIGLAQCIAFIPGTSRSGITITAARFLNYDRREAARFSMLLSIPTILGAGVLAGLDLYKMGDFALTLDLLLAAFLSFLVALCAVFFMMEWLKKASFTLFVIYRFMLGGVLFYILYA